jgi:hypothetical protein
MSMKPTDVGKLVTFIEEHLRASPTAGLRFVDPRHLKSRISSRQNHVVFGRRGAGKSKFISSLEDEAGQLMCVVINLEDFKDISFPNIIVHVLKKAISELIKVSGKLSPAYKGYFRSALHRRKLRKMVACLGRLLVEQDFEERQLKSKATTERSGNIKAEKSGAGGSTGYKNATEEQVDRIFKWDKLDELRRDLTIYKEALDETSKNCGGRSIFLILDDFYFVPKSRQPEFIDFFHRLTKGTSLFLKVATIRYRSKLYRQTGESFIGVELGHDIIDIDMDYTLDKFDDLQQFMHKLLERAIEDSEANVGFEDLFAGDGFTQLCLASGGVPRDFLSLFVKLANSLENEKKIGKVEVTAAAIGNISSKTESLRVDSASERQALEAYLAALRRMVYNDKRTNCFLVAKQEIDDNPYERQAIRELVDLRLIHLVDLNTSSAPSDGRRYEAYMLDVGLYENSRPRNFTQIEPGVRDDKSRRDELRAAPRISLIELRRRAEEIGFMDPLTLSEEKR